MVKVVYVGVTDPAREFEALRPAFKQVIQMMRQCRPMGDDYKALLAISDAMNGAAHHFMPVEHHSFFGAKPHS